MKKRVKLLTTIASLCLAVALMAFGVYAANSVNLTASGKVTFTSTDISGAWSLAVAVENGTPNAPTATITGETATIPNVLITDISQECVITLTATFTNSSTTGATLAAPTINAADGTGYTFSGALVSEASQLTVEAGNGETGVVVVKLTLKVTDLTQSNTAGVDYSVAFTATSK